MSLAEDALAYHADGRPGKIEVRSTKPTRTQNDLSLAYSPGVAEPCLVIEKNPDASFEYTARSNLVAVIMVNMMFIATGAVMIEALLSYLGRTEFRLSWGSMIWTAQDDISSFS